MTSTDLSCDELINAARIPGKDGLYFLGPYTPRITFFSQQVRALRLARALHTLGHLKASQGIGIIGAGAAGATMSVALALLGHKVTLFDQSDAILHLQSGSARLLHPHIYEWPQFGSLDNRAGLPILDWLAGEASAVVPFLRTEFGRLGVGLPQLDFKSGHVLTGLEPSGSEWAATFTDGSEPVFRHLDHVFLTLGFGGELPCGDVAPEDYWKPGAVGTNTTEAVKGTSYLVSGNGDGALTVLLGLLIQNFEHAAFTRDFLSFSRPDKLRDAADQVFAGKNQDDDVEDAMRATVLPILLQYGVVDLIRTRLRSDRAVTVNANGPLFAAGKASQLNQCMALALLEAARLKSIVVTRSVGFVSACAKSDTGVTPMGTTIAGVPDTMAYKHVIFRHGPDIKKRYSPSGDLIDQYATHIKSLIAANAHFAMPPALDDETYSLFEAKRIEHFELPATRDAARAAALDTRHVIEITVDEATKTIVERGCRRVTDIADECERLADRYRIDLHVAPTAIAQARDLVRLAMCSNQKIELRASADVHAAWNRLTPGIVQAPLPSSVRGITAFGDRALANYVDACLVRLLDHGVLAAIAAGGAVLLGSIGPEIVAEVAATWPGWRDAMTADPRLRFDFLRWLANVEQQVTTPWNGDYASLKHMINALIMITATHAGEPLTPTSVASGNLSFAPGGVAIGTGCEGIGLQLLSSRMTPDDWGADALILAAAHDVIVSDPAGTVLDGGDPGTSIKVARRVRPAIIQNDPRWRQRLSGPLADWQQAVEAEFAAWRERQDAEVKRVSA